MLMIKLLSINDKQMLVWLHIVDKIQNEWLKMFQTIELNSHTKLFWNPKISSLNILKLSPTPVYILHDRWVLFTVLKKLLAVWNAFQVFYHGNKFELQSFKAALLDCKFTVH